MGQVLNDKIWKEVIDALRNTDQVSFVTPKDAGERGRGGGAWRAQRGEASDSHVPVAERVGEDRPAYPSRPAPFRFGFSIQVRACVHFVHAFA